MTDLPFTFPVLRIPDPDETDVRHAFLCVHCYDIDFILASEEHRDGSLFVGQLIFDALGRSWRLNGLTDLGYGARPFLGRVFGFIDRVNDIRYELSEELGIPFSEIKRRVLSVIAAKPSAYSDGEHALGTFDASDANEALPGGFVTRVRNAERPLELIAAVHFHDIM